jgi:phosphoribosylformylglycinamidine synthase
MGFNGVSDVRAGKVIVLDLAETDPVKAQAQAEEMAGKLLANTVIESFRVMVQPE